MNSNISEIKITGFPIPPWANVAKKGDTNVIIGLNGYLLDYIATSLNFTYQFVPPIAYEYGSRNATGHYSGVLGMLQRGDLDFISAPTVHTWDRMDAIEFTLPFWHSHTVILSGKPFGFTSDPFGYLMSFDVEIWIALLIALVVVAGLISLLERLDPNIETKEKENVFGGHVWSFMGIIVYQSSEYMPKKRDGKTLFVTWCFSIMIMMNVFSGSMKARLTDQGDPERIDSLKDLSKYPRVQPIVADKSAITAYFQFSDDPVRQMLWKQIKATKGNVPGITLFSPRNMEETYQSKSVIINEFNIVMYRLGETCSGREYYVGKETFLPMSFTFAVGKHLPKDFLEDVNVRIARYFDSCHMQYRMKAMYYKVSACLPENWVREDMAMDIKSMWPVFMLWMIGNGISFSVLILEIIWRQIEKL